MMFSAMPGPPNYYASPVPPPRRSNALPIVLGIGCSGCFLLLILMAAVLFPVFQQARQKARETVSARAAERFLTDLRDHQYDQAISLMAPEGQQTLTPATLQKLAQQIEHRYGPLQTWRRERGKSSSGGGESVFLLNYQLLYKRGTAYARFVATYNGSSRGLISFGLHEDASNTSHDTSP